MLLRNYIDGTFVEPIHNDTIAVINPSTGETIHQVVNSSQIEINLAVEAAEKAFSSWSSLSSEIRSDYLMAIASEIEKRFEEFAFAESIDSGKPISLTRKMDIPRAIQNLKFFAQAATQFSSEFHDSPGNQSINYTLRSPLGAVHFTLEFAFILIYLENSASISGRKYGNSQTLRSDPAYCLLAEWSLYQSRFAKWGT